MFTEITKSAFNDAFIHANRESSFSYEGRNALFDYFTEYEESTGEKIELDVIAICCDWTEYETFEDLQSEYPHIRNIEQLQYHTQVIEIPNSKGILIIQF